MTRRLSFRVTRPNAFAATNLTIIVATAKKCGKQGHTQPECNAVGALFDNLSEVDAADELNEETHAHMDFSENGSGENKENENVVITQMNAGKVPAPIPAVNVYAMVTPTPTTTAQTPETSQ